MADRVKERDCIDDWNTKTKGGGWDGGGGGNTGVRKPPALASPPRFSCEWNILRFHTAKFDPLACPLLFTPLNLRSKNLKIVVTNSIRC
jgi:hypothetical protein